MKTAVATIKHLTSVKLGLGFLLIMAGSAHADWQLDEENSSLYYISSKAAAVSEVNTFHELSGNIDADGNAVLQISLSSVDSAIEIRDQRLREILFNVAQYPLAEVMLTIDPQRLEHQAAGESSSEMVTASLNLHGMQKDINAQVLVNKLSDSSIQVQAIKPIIVNAAEFGLAEGIEELRNIAGLPSINNNVAVTFSLIFSQ